MKIGIVGFGVVGSATGKGLRELGHEVYINDIKDLSKYESDFKVREAGNYSIGETEMTMLALPTPTVSLGVGGRINLRNLEDVIEELGEQLKVESGYHVFTVRSTVPPGTSREMGKRLAVISGKDLGDEFGLCMNPEFLRAYNNEEDFRKPRATIIGSYDKKSGEILKRVYRKIESPVHLTTLEEAEMIKYTNNIANAVKISFYNEIHSICERMGIDFETVRKAVATTAESNWNSEYGTHGGIPYGGTCLPKDTKCLFRELESKGFHSKVLEATILMNDEMIKKESANKNAGINGHKKNGKKANGKNGNGALNTYFKGRMHSSYENIQKRIEGE